MSKGPEVERKFVKKGNVVLVKQIVKDVELPPKEICDNLEQIRANIKKGEEQLGKIEEQKVQTIADIDSIKNSLAEMSKFEDWAMEIQESKIKNYIGEVIDECAKAIDDEYSEDGTLTVEQNANQKYAMLQRKISATEKIAGEICRAVIHDKLFNNSIVPNPWKA